MSIHDYPRCASYLKAMEVRLDDPSMSDYWFAVILGDRIPEGALKRAGVDFSNREDTGILGRIEAALTSQKTKRQRHGPGLIHSDFESLKAFFGSRGVKASRLKSGEDFWRAAHCMWPKYFCVTEMGSEHFRAFHEGDLRSLHKVLKSMTKRERRTADLSRLPEEWRAA